MGLLSLVILIRCIIINQRNKFVMSIFKINTNGVFSVKEKTKEFYKMLIGGIIFYLLLFFATKYTIDSKGYFIFIIIFLTMLYSFIFVFIPITLIIRIKKVVRKIQFDDKQILITTKKKFIYNKGDLLFKEVQNRFTGFSIRNKSGILLMTKENKEFWIVEDFFNDYEELKRRFISPPLER